MTRIMFVWITAALVGCGTTHVDSTTTTSANVTPNRVAVPVWSPSPQVGDSQMPFDLPPALIRENPDAKITSMVLESILIDANLSPRAKEVGITTHDGRVTLSGNVPTEHERQRIDNRARSVPGVRVVEDRMEIEP
jgi:hypothetical protein